MCIEREWEKFEQTLFDFMQQAKGLRIKLES